MPILLFILIVVMIAQIGFWDTFGAVVGAVAMVALFLVLVAASLAIGGYLALRRIRD